MSLRSGSLAMLLFCLLHLQPCVHAYLQKITTVVLIPSWSSSHPVSQGWSESLLHVKPLCSLSFMWAIPPFTVCHPLNQRAKAWMLPERQPACNTSFFLGRAIFLSWPTYRSENVSYAFRWLLRLQAEETTMTKGKTHKARHTQTLNGSGNCFYSALPNPVSSVRSTHKSTSLTLSNKTITSRISHTTKIWACYWSSLNEFLSSNAKSSTRK